MIILITKNKTTIKKMSKKVREVYFEENQQRVRWTASCSSSFQYDYEYVGAASEVVLKEKKDRVDDALSATRAAVEEGIIPGGGVTFIRSITAIENFEGDNADETTGIAIVKKALESPLRQIVENAGLDGSVVVQKIKEGKDDFGYNARTDKYESLYAAGVIDPTKVTRVALENAASIASMFITTECVVADIEEEAPAAAMPPMGGGMGGGMGMM